MKRLLPFMVAPSLLLLGGCAAASMVPDAVEVRPGCFVLQGVPDGGTFASLKQAGVTHVLNLRTPAEGPIAQASAQARAAGASYDSCPMDREPSPASLDAFRAQMKALPKGARVLLHCASGNRVGGALLTYWVLDEGMDPTQALKLAKQAGLQNPATERAAKAYIALRRRSN